MKSSSVDLRKTIEFGRSRGVLKNKEQEYYEIW